LATSLATLSSILNWVLPYGYYFGVPQQKGTLGMLLVWFLKEISGSGFGNQTGFCIT
jgi:hypothetical protein